MKEIAIIFKSELESISIIRNMVSSLVIGKNQTITFLNELKTVISEGITNAIIHGYEGNNDNDIIVKVSLNDKGIFISIEDFGIGIEDISKAREVLYSTKTSLDRSGLGFTIMELFSTNFKVTSNVGSGTLLEIFKQWE